MEWAEIFLNHRKGFRLIDNFSKENEHFLVSINQKKSKFFVFEDLSKSIDFLEENCFIATLNKKQNLDFLIKNWNLFVEKSVTIYFVNPDLNEKWVLNTKVHSFISDKNVALGLNSLFSTVQEVNE
jgi:pyoverdine/dityrosine biosynthesis protein Dit1